MRNWGELLPEMVYLVCKKVDTFKDLVAFGGVCSTWRNEAVKQNLGQPLLPLPWLMLAENQNDDLREFYNVSDGNIYGFNLPELRGKMCVETKGWIFTASDKGEMTLVHPLTRVLIPLPHQNTSEIYEKNPMEPLLFVTRVVLSSPPDPKNQENCVVGILHGGMGHFGFCRLGDEVWTVPKKDFWSATAALEFYRGKFYVLNFEGHVWEYDVIGKSCDAGPVTIRRIGVNIHEHLVITAARPYLVQSADSLLVIFKENNGDDGNYRTTEFWVLEIDVELNGYKEVTGLGTRAIFLGQSATLSVDTIWYPELVLNSIYFTDDFVFLYLNAGTLPVGAGMDMGVYNLEDKSLQPHYNGKSLSFVCPPIWTFLTSR